MSLASALMNSRIDRYAKAATTSYRALPPQTRLQNHEIESVVAQSNFSVVYRAVEQGSGRVVAIKEYLPHSLALRHAHGRVAPRSEDFAGRFELGRQAFIEEARSLARFNHPSLVRVLGLFEAHGTAYRVMRFTPGPTLLEHRQALGRVPALEDVRLWLDGLLGALSALHVQGCMHGAVTPADILLRPGEHAMLLDFGSVREALIADRRPYTLPSARLPFMPPERRAPPALLGPPTPATDLYSLAASLHYGLTGQLPATPAPGRAPTPVEPLVAWWERTTGGAPMRLDMAQLFTALDACLAEDPRQRPQSVAAMRECLGGAPAVAERAVIAERAESGAGAGFAELAQVEVDLLLPDEAEVCDEPPVPDCGTVAANGVDARPPEESDPIPEAAPSDLPGAPLPVAEPRGDASAPDAWVAAPPVAPPPWAVVASDGQAVGMRRRFGSGSPARRAAAAAALAVGLLFGAGLWWSERSVSSATSPSPSPRWAQAQPEPPDPTGVQAAADATPLVFDPPAAGRPSTESLAPLGKPLPVAVPTDLPVDRLPRSAPPTEPSPQAPLEASTAELVPLQAPAVPAQAGSARALALPTVAEAGPPRKVAARVAPASPRQACGNDAGFALYQCMQLQCAKSGWATHAQCAQLRRSDAVD